MARLQPHEPQLMAHLHGALDSVLNTEEMIDSILQMRGVAPRAVAQAGELIRKARELLHTQLQDEKTIAA